LPSRSNLTRWRTRSGGGYLKDDFCSLFFLCLLSLLEIKNTFFSFSLQRRRNGYGCWGMDWIMVTPGVRDIDPALPPAAYAINKVVIESSDDAHPLAVVHLTALQLAEWLRENFPRAILSYSRRKILSAKRAGRGVLVNYTHFLEFPAMSMTVQWLQHSHRSSDLVSKTSPLASPKPGPINPRILI